LYLDAVKPQWARIINLNALRLEKSSQCVLGQCFGGYFSALNKLVPQEGVAQANSPESAPNQTAFAERFGFQVPEKYMNSGGYERLGLAWKAQIKVRRQTRSRARV
jgi:hypothetical protein